MTSTTLLCCIWLVAACSNDALKDDPTPDTTPSPGGRKPPAETIPTDANMQRLLRRLSLDTTGQLPSQADRKAAVNNEALEAIVNTYASSQAAANTLAEQFRLAWNLRSASLPDLDQLVTQGDTTLDASLTDSIRLGIIDEPVQLLRYIFSKDLPFAATFTAEYSIAQSGVLSLWGMTQLNQAWNGGALYFGQFADSRPPSGLLTTNGFLANFASEQRSDLRARTWEMLQRVTCAEQDNRSAHEFADLSYETLATDMPTYANDTAVCAVCHKTYQSAATAFNGLGASTSFASWLTYSPNSTPAEATYAGHAFTGLEQLGTMVGNDPRVWRCSLKKLFEATVQRPFNDGRRSTTIASSDAYDVQDLYKAYDKYLQKDGRLPAGWRQIFGARRYNLGLNNEKTLAAPKATNFETRYLTQHQWRMIVTQLTGASETFALLDDLDPGSWDTFAPEYRVPSGPYWHAVNRIARQLATKIVDLELDTNAQPSNRRLLTALPAGAGNTATTDQVKAQIQAVWDFLTSYSLAADHEQIAQLYTLWSSASAGGSSAAQHRDAWRTLIAGILLSDQFVTY